MKISKLFAFTLSLFIGIFVVHPNVQAADTDVGVSISKIDSGMYGYVMEVKNYGSENATNVVVNNPLETGVLAYVSHMINVSPGSCGNESGVIVCRFDSLAGGETVRIDVNVYAIEADVKKIVNRVSVASDGVDGKSRNNTDSFVYRPRVGR